MSFEDGTLRSKKVMGKAAGIKTLTIWSRTFLVYVSIVSTFHGVKHPAIVSKLISFHNDIIQLADTYDWQKAVLVLALFYHLTALAKGFADLAA